MALTKSLHTVTATVNVARTIMEFKLVRRNDGDSAAVYVERLTRGALDVLGYDLYELGLSDPTVIAIMRQIAKRVGQ